MLLQVRQLFWGGQDQTLVSCGQDGAVYQWDVDEAKRLGEFVQKGTAYSCALRSAWQFKVKSSQLTTHGLLLSYISSQAAELSSFTRNLLMNTMPLSHRLTAQKNRFLRWETTACSKSWRSPICKSSKNSVLG